MAVSVTLSGSTGRVVSGSYVLSHGITPAIITVEVIPGTGQLSLLNDIVFSDGSRQVVSRDCRLAGVSLAVSETYGRVWRVTLHDHRWRWQYGYVTASYTTESAFFLATFLLAYMGESSYDVSALPQNEGPVVEWDFKNPAQALAEICDRYGCLIVFDPDTLRVSIWPKGSGSVLTEGWPYDALDHTITIPDVPNELVGVCEYTEHEVDLELEPVGLDADGTIKHIDSIGYRPIDGWGADFLYFGHVSGEDNQKLAQQSIYRWYRVKGNQAVAGWKAVVSLSELRPISGKRIATEIQIATDGSSETVRKPAYVHGIFDLSKGVLENSEVLTKHPDNFQLDENTGIVKFSRPIFASSASTIIAPTLYLRCTVFSERHTRSRSLGGVYGLLPIPCAGIARQIVSFNAVENLTASDNTAAIDAEVDAILDTYARRYATLQAGQAHYIGIWPARLDGRIQQVSWDVGKGGAFTSASENTEQDIRSPSAVERRTIEKQRSPVAEGLQVQTVQAASPEKKGDSPATLAQEPRWIRIYNNGTDEIGAYGPVLLGSIRSDGVYNATIPTVDDQRGLLVCGPVEIGVGDYGLVSGDFPLVCAVSSASVGDRFGSGDDSEYWFRGTRDGMIVVAVIDSNHVLGCAYDIDPSFLFDPDHTFVTGEILAYNAGEGGKWANTDAPMGLLRVGVSDGYYVDGARVVRERLAGIAKPGAYDLTGTDTVDKANLLSYLYGLKVTQTLIIGTLELHGLIDS